MRMTDVVLVRDCICSSAWGQSAEIFRCDCIKVCLIQQVVTMEGEVTRFLAAPRWSEGSRKDPVTVSLSLSMSEAVSL